jgi:hypothetical protein
MMGELHWTGAALLLALAALGGKSTRPRPHAISTSSQGARAPLPPEKSARRQPRRRAAARRVVALAAQRPVQRARLLRYRAEAPCSPCDWTAGAVEWDAAARAAI